MGREKLGTEELLAKIRPYARNGMFSFTKHCYLRMRERKISEYEVWQILNTVRIHEKRKDIYKCDFGDWVYAVRGTTVDSNETVRLCLTFTPHGLLIVTAIRVS